MASEADDSPEGLPGPRSRHLLPYERRLVAWELWRFRARGKYDGHDSEYVRLLAAYIGGWHLSIAFYVAGVVICIVAGLYSPYLVFAGLGVGGIGVVVAFVGGHRMSQAEDMLKEHQQTRPFTAQ